MNELRAKRHTIISTHVSEAAREMLLDTPDTDEAIKTIADDQLHAWYQMFPDGYIADINGVYGQTWTLVGTSIVLHTCCKVRGYRKAIGETGWMMGIMTQAEWDMMFDADEDERNDLTAKSLCLHGKDLLNWCETYG